MMNAEQQKYKVGTILFPGFELLDVFGPLEMFGMSGAFDLFMVGMAPGFVTASYGTRVEVDYSGAALPACDVLLIPGGSGTRKAIEDPAFMDFLATAVEKATCVASVCTGSALLAKLGLLDGLKATSNKRAFHFAEVQSHKVVWQKQARWVEDGIYFTSSGVSAGMDMALALIGKMVGRDLALRTAQAAEYLWNENSGNDPFAI